MCFNKQSISTLLFAIISIQLIGQGNQQLTSLWPVVDQELYVGFNKSLAGTEIDYFLYLKKGKIALYVGENGLHKSISFQTEPIPAEYDKENITYVWQAAISKNSGDEVSTFQMAINDNLFMELRSYQPDDDESWSYATDDIELTFIHTHSGKANGERYGYMFLKLPIKNFSKEEPVTIRVSNEKSNAKDFFTVNQNPVEESLDIFAETAIMKTPDGPKQTVRVELTYLGLPTEARILANGQLINTTDIRAGKNDIYLHFEPVDAIRNVELVFKTEGRTDIKRTVELNPVRHYEVYFLPHSHVDIGFTHEQDEVARLQWENLDLALDLIDQTDSYPKGSQYKWNAEISWVLDGYLKQANPEQKRRFLKAVKDEKIGIDAMYGSVLTGLQREEEMFHNTFFAKSLADKYGFDIQSAMITDVPGYTWGTVPTLRKMGIKYFSVGPNHMPQLAHGGWQVGKTLEAWGDVPFYWKSPSGKDKILFWMSSHGYSWFHSWSTGNISHAGGVPILNFLDELNLQQYPYDIVQLRYNIGNDNGPPDPDMPAFFKAWNEKYEWPKFKIATTMAMMEEFEDRYKDIIPEDKGDFTPYWEDGAASSATETALNRKTADRLVQAETLWAMINPSNYPKDKIQAAWTGVVLFSEHTWGALQSKSDPDGEFTKKLWEVKKGYGQDAADAAEASIKEVLTPLTSSANEIGFFQIVNTLSWNRTGLIKLPKEWELIGDRIFDDNGKEQPTQRLKTGELAFVAKNIPALGSMSFLLKKGKSKGKSQFEVSESSISNGLIELEMNTSTGAIASITEISSGRQFIDGTDTLGFNSYWYSGLITKDISRNHTPQFRIVEQGPVVAAIEVTTLGEGANTIKQYIEIAKGLNRIKLVNTVDKLKVVDNENVRFSFPFEVPDGQVRIDIPWSVLSPGKNQLKGANLNFYSVQRFLDISNQEYGITLSTVDAPIWEIGEMSGQYWMKDMKLRPWIKSYKPSQTLFTWGMNNAWFVNYKAYQEGEIRFQYSLIPHGKFSAAESKKRGMEDTMPLIVFPAEKDQKIIQPPFVLLGSEDVIMTSFKPSQDGKGWMIRFLNSSNTANNFEVKWQKGAIQDMYESSPLEVKGEEIMGEINLIPWEIFTIRVEQR